MNYNRSEGANCKESRGRGPRTFAAVKCHPPAPNLSALISDAEDYLGEFETGPIEVSRLRQRESRPYRGADAGRLDG